MKVWIVLDSDYDSTTVAAVYMTSALAEAHIAEMGGCLSEQDVLDFLHPDVTDPALIQRRLEAALKWRREFEERQRQEAWRQQQIEAARPSPRMNLCSCQTFYASPHFITEHGYCSYCGGFTPEVFREQLGEAALQTAIDKLEIHRRLKMREIVGSPAQSEDAGNNAT